MKLRFDKPYPECDEVPGQFVWKRKKPTPVNCRRLLRTPLPAPAWAGDIPTPPEIRDNGQKLFPWQIRAARFALPRAGAYFYHCAGAGKSFSALWTALCWGGPVLWITKAFLKTTVYREVTHRSTIRPLVLEGKTPEKITNTRLAIHNYECLVAWEEELCEFVSKGGVVIFDEVHSAKQWKRAEKGVDPDSGRIIWRKVANVSSAAASIGRAATRRLGLSATPIPDSRADLWSQLDIIEPDCWGDNWAFTHRYCDAKPGEYGGIDTTGQSNSEEFRARIAEVMHKVDKEELLATLPPVRRQLVYLTKAEQCKPPAGNADEMKRAAKAGPMALLEARFMEAAARKRKWVMDFTLERVNAGQKVTILTGRRIDVDILGTAFKEKGLRYCWAIHGGHSDTERTAATDAYMGVKTEGALLIGTTDIMGIGLNLQDTDVGMFALLPYTPRMVLQGEGRWVRPGMTRPTEIIYPIAEGTVDETVADILLTKLEAVSETLDDGEAGAVGGLLAGDASDEAIIAGLLSKV